ncbi:MAG: deoxyribodipyrimidine photo-lyase [Pseudomonadota bacterium]
MRQEPILWWIRRDFRLAENPALTAAVASGLPVIPVFLFDEVAEALPASPAWRTGLGLGMLSDALEGCGSRLILRRGPALQVLSMLASETGAKAVYWNRLYDSDAQARDTRVKAGLKEAGIGAQSFAAHVLHEPWTVKTGQGGYYRVYSPFWRAVKDRPVAPAEPAPSRISAPEIWPHSDKIADWDLARAMGRGARVVHPHLLLGESAARTRLDEFLAGPVRGYRSDRNRLDRDGTSRLSEPLTYGEIGPRTVWHGGMAALNAGLPGAETFLKELVWRDFAHHLVFHTPHITTKNWREGWDSFPWSSAETADVLAWKQGRTGVQVVDAAMREMYVTGRMHNRARMLVASYLTKHMMTHWRLGQAWFADCLVDWDPASNAMGWQWTAGSGPDAAPYFRIFNPETQAEKFDPDGRYRQRWLAELPGPASDDALSFFAAIPQSWNLSSDLPYPSQPIVALGEGRKRALAAYEARQF